MNNVVLSVLAHPDDAEFLCAGTLIRLGEQGWEVHIASMTPGDCGSAEFPPDEIARIRRAEGAQAAALIRPRVAIPIHWGTFALPRPASLLYLDSFDVEPENPLPSAIHHALELAAARPLLAPGSIVCVDDYGLGEQGGKGMIVDKFFTAIGAEVLYSGYQKAWRVR